VNVTVNGKPRQVESSLTLLGFLESLGVNPKLVAVEHNGDIIRRENFETVSLAEGDVLEIIHMVGGG